MTPPAKDGGAVALDAGVLREMEAHACEAYPDECCGALVASGDAHPVVMRFRNVQDEMHATDPARYPRTARVAYVPHPSDLKHALDAGDEPRGRLVAFYHSHPDHGAYFSHEDVAQATPFGEPSYPDALQIVVSVYERRVRDVKVFRWSASETAYVEAPLVRG